LAHKIGSVVFIPEFVATEAFGALVKLVVSTQFDEARLVVEVKPSRAFLTCRGKRQVRLCPACAAHLESDIGVEQVE